MNVVPSISPPALGCGAALRGRLRRCWLRLRSCPNAANADAADMTRMPSAPLNSDT